MISLITAIDRNGLIGKGNGLPWDYPEDLKYFKSITSGKTVIMGDTTFETLSRPLPKRENIVASLENKQYEGAKTITNLFEYLDSVPEEKEVFIIGGAKIYELAERYVDRLYITHIAALHEGDIRFPNYDWSKFSLVSETTKGILTFAVYERINES